MKLVIDFQVTDDLTWPLWAELTQAVERLGFAGVSLSDHFPDGGDALETITALTYLASHSRMLQLGMLVSPLSFRDPVMLARQAMLIDALSGGRMVLGIGAGWIESEHTMFGYDLGDLKTREARFEEGVQVITLLVRNQGPVSFDGRFFHLRNARLHAHSGRPMPILIGGNGPKRTLPIVAKYADIWNGQASVEAFKERSALLDTLILQAGRKPSDVKRTLFLPVLHWRDEQEMEQIATRFKATSMFANMSTEKVFEWLTANMAAVIGSTDSVLEKLQAFEAAGAEEIHVTMFGTHKLDHLESLARDILPHFTE
jgi:alkanesulfonate monooxygenase SsuD/methylene tetrahydromethanopterin reductase-like flavin-dependent oxidoreductase (luciferase family)